MRRIHGLLEARSGVLAFFAYGLLAVGMTLPVATRLTTHLVGYGNDPYIHYWKTWWVGEALRRGTSPHFTDMLFHPNGASLVYHNFAWLNIAGSLVLRPVAGPVGAYDFVYLANMALCGFAMYHLVDYVGAHFGWPRPAGWLAAGPMVSALATRVVMQSLRARRDSKDGHSRRSALARRSRLGLPGQFCEVGGILSEDVTLNKSRVTVGLCERHAGTSRPQTGTAAAPELLRPTGERGRTSVDHLAVLGCPPR